MRNPSPVGWEKFLAFLFILSIGAGGKALAEAKDPAAYSGHLPRQLGAPLIQNYSPKVYNAHVQNWAIAQDRFGIMYFGNGSGLLQYDGVSWRLFPVPNFIVRSLAVKGDTIFMGGRNEFGYWIRDSLGVLRYTSLSKWVPTSEQSFQDVWNVLVSSRGVFFQTFSHLFLWDPKSAEKPGDAPALKIWKPDSLFHTAFVVNDQLYILERKQGLLTLVGDSLHLVPDGEKLARDRLYVMLPYPGDQPGKIDSGSNILVGTQNHGLLIYDGRSFRKFRTEASVFLKENGIYLPGAVLSDGTYAIGTTRGGVVIIDREGRLRNLVNKASGLRDQSVYYVFSDRQGALWLALQRGIARVQLHLPVTVYDERAGLQGSIYSLARYKGKLYLGTNLGLFVLAHQASFSEKGAFRAVPEINTDVWQLLIFRSRLLAAIGSGVYEIRDGEVRLIHSAWREARSLAVSQEDSGKVYVGLMNGLAVLRFRKGQWHDEGIIIRLPIDVRSIAEERSGVLWLGTFNNGVWRIELLQDGRMTVRRYGRKDGIEPAYVRVAGVKGRMLFSTIKGLRHFDARRQIFVPDSSLGDVFADTSVMIGGIAEDASGDLWIPVYRQNHLDIYTISWDNGQPYVSGHIPVTSILRNYFIDNVEIFCDVSDGAIWLGCNDGLLIRYSNPKGVLNPVRMPFYTVIRRIVVNDDSVLVDGCWTGSRRPESFSRLSQMADAELPRFEPHNNSIRFEVAAAFYDNEKAVQYQFFLQGFNRSWSAWTTETVKEYTNLPPGSYIFRVRARDMYGNLSHEARYPFIVLPPWYRRWWAFTVFAGAVLLFVFVVIKSRVYYLEKKTRRLEQIVAERTQKIREQAEKLKELDRLKSDFFANISHEFRTPLTLILGPLENLRARSGGTEVSKQLQIVIRQARRLERLIDQLLDLSRIEAGKMVLHPRYQDIVSFLRQIFAVFEMAATQKKVRLEFDARVPHLIVSFDPDKMEHVITNLLSNALKYTRPGDTITLRVNRVEESKDAGESAAEKPNERKKMFRFFVPPRASRPQKSERLHLSWVEITVRDTGIGISKDHLPFIFDRFYRVEHSQAVHHGGTGIGLAYAKELVELHGGQIFVESDYGKGTTFVLKLPLDPQIQPKPATEKQSKPADLSVATLEDGQNGFQEAATISSEADQQPEDEEIILVVDDNPDMRMYIRDCLEPDFRVIDAEDGKKGFHQAVTHIPDLIIADVMMPEMDGFQLCRCLKDDERTSHIPVIMLTARAGEEDKISGLLTGADDYLVKPFSKRELVVRIRNLIRIRRRLWERFRSMKAVIKPSEIIAASIDQQFLKKVVHIVEEHMDDPEFSVEELSRHLGMSRSQVHRKLTGLTGLSASKFIRWVRLARAADLLQKNAGNLAEIAYRVGFNSQSYFIKCFKEQFGCSPSEYRKSVSCQ